MIRSVLTIPTAPNAVSVTVLPGHGMRRRSCALTLAVAVGIALLGGCGETLSPGADSSTTRTATGNSGLPEVVVVASRS
jgi:hypothetical protein